MAAALGDSPLYDVMVSTTREITTTSAAATSAAGEALGAWLRDGDVVLLHGDLGAGKTTLAKGIAAALNIDAVVSSPSFALVNEYETGPGAPASRLYHLDLYRLTDPVELDTIGFTDLMAPSDGLTLVEWPERAADALPDRYLLIAIEAVAPDTRRLRVSAAPDDESWATRLSDLHQRLKTTPSH